MKSVVILLFSICVVSANVCTTEDQAVGSPLSASFGIPGYSTTIMFESLEDIQRNLLYFIGYFYSSTPWQTIIYKSDLNLSKVKVMTYNIHIEHFSYAISPSGDFIYFFDKTTNAIMEINSDSLAVSRKLSISSATININWHIEASSNLFFSFMISSAIETCRWDMTGTNLDWLTFGVTTQSNFVSISDDLLFFSSVNPIDDDYYLIVYNFSDTSNLVWKRRIICPTSGWTNRMSSAIISQDEEWIYTMILYDENFIFYKLNITDGSPQNPGFIWSDSGYHYCYSMEEFSSFIAIQIHTPTVENDKRLVLINRNNTEVLNGYKSIDSRTYFIGRMIYNGEELMYHGGRNNTSTSFFMARTSINNVGQLPEFEEDSPLFTKIISDYQNFPTTSSPSLTSSTNTLTISTSTSITETDITSTINPSFNHHVALLNQDHIQSVQGNSSVQLDFTWAWFQPTNFINIVFTLAQTGSNELPEWVHIDTANQQLYLNKTPKFTESKVFYFSLQISFNSEVYFKKFEITVESWQIMNWDVCQLGSPGLWETWTADYEATDDQRSCSKITSMPGATEAAAAMVTSSVVLASVSSMLSLSSVNSIFSIMNSLQLAVLLPLVPDYISPKVLDFLSSMGFTMLSFDFIKFKDIPFVEAISNWVSYPQSDEYLNNLGMRSGSSVVNYLSLMAVIILVGAIHLGILWWYLCTENSKHRKCNKFLGALLKFLTFNIYIRIFIQAFSFTTLSIFSELYTFNLSTTVTKVSLGLWIVFGLCTSVLFILSFIMYAKSFPEFDKKKYWPWVEYFNGIKPKKFSKLYSSLFMLLRLLLSSLLIFGATISGSTKGTYFYLLNIAYWLYLIGVRPFENPQDSIIEIINQTMFCCLAVPLSWLNTKESWTKFYESYYTTIFMVSPAICSLVWLIFLIKSIVVYIIKYRQSRANTTITPKEPSPNTIRPRDQEEQNQNPASSIIDPSNSFNRSNVPMAPAEGTINRSQRRPEHPVKIKIRPRI